MSWIFTTISRLRPMNSTFYHNIRIARQLCNYTKDLSKQSLASGSDLLMVNLKQASTTNAVLDMVSMHGRIMNNKHIMQALRSLFMLQKAGSSALSTNQILCDPSFNKLCRQLKFQAGIIDINETIEALKVVLYVGVPSNSTIIQILLQLIRHNINELNLHQIIFMDFLLNHCQSTPLVDALKIALPIVFEINLPLKLDYESQLTLSDCLFYAVRNKLKFSSIALIVNSLMKIREPFELKVAKSVVWSICDSPADDNLAPLMKKALQSLIIHFDELNYNEMETTLSKLSSRFTLNLSNYCYDEVFFDSCANYVIDNDLGFKHAVYMLRKFARTSHACNFLLDYMSKKVHENPKLISEGQAEDIYSIAVSVCLTEYRPVHWDHLKHLIEISENIGKSERKEIIWIRFGAALCLLDIFKVDVLNRCLNEKYLHHLFNNKRFYSDFENYSKIWQSIKLLKPELSCLLPQSFNPEVLIKRLQYEFEFPLEGALHKALGGEKYVLTNVYTKLGHHLDHVIVFRKGGYPVAANNSEEIQFIEDLETTGDNYFVTIQCLEPLHYTLNKRRLKYHAISTLRMLESKGYIVVPICLDVWQSLADFEKIPYLMQAIKEKTDSTGCSISESVT